MQIAAPGGPQSESTRQGVHKGWSAEPLVDPALLPPGAAPPQPIAAQSNKNGIRFIAASAAQFGPTDHSSILAWVLTS
jgi:hypothetical protein